MAYAIHAGMASKVKRWVDGKKRDGVEEVDDSDEMEARNQKAMELWIKVANREGL